MVDDLQDFSIDDIFRFGSWGKHEKGFCNPRITNRVKSMVPLSVVRLLSVFGLAPCRWIWQKTG